MRVEVESAANFVCYLLAMGKAKISRRKIEMFKSKLIENLLARYRDHWFPDNPLKGCGYRAVRNSGRFLDPELDAAAGFAGIRPVELFFMLPPHLVIWVDPWEVSYRLDYSGEVVTLCKWTCDEENRAAWFYPDRALGTVPEEEEEQLEQKQNVEPETAPAVEDKKEKAQLKKMTRADVLSVALRSCSWAINGVLEGLTRIRSYGSGIV